MNKLGNILIVDDNSTNIQVAAGILEKNGYDTEYALDAISAFAWLNSKDFDLILLDVMMPGMDGFEACKTIKETPEWKLIPVIFVTARTDRQSLVKGFEAGGSDYITKPFDTQELLVRVHTQVELKKNRYELTKVNAQLADLLENKETELIESSQDLVAANRELLAKNAELEKIERSKQSFFRVLGNEVGTSLHDITGMLQVIKHRVDSRKVAQLVDRIDHSLLTLETMVNTALRITELQSADKHLKPERIELNKLVGFSMFQLDEKIRRKQIRLENAMSADAFYIIGESRLLKAGLMIIFDFFLERNTPNSVIKITASKLEHGVNITISDNGTFLSNEETENLFDPYKIGTQSLSLAKMIAESHMGELKVINRPSAGIDLTISLFSKDQPISP